MTHLNDAHHLGIHLRVLEEIIDFRDSVVRRRVIDKNQLILVEKSCQLLCDHGQEHIDICGIVMQIHDRRDKFVFPVLRKVHYRNSSRSYTVLILPDKTLTSRGYSLFTRIAVGLESSTSEDFRIGFIEYKDP